MNKLHFPYINLPQEFVALLKSNLSVHSSSSVVLDIIRPNKAMYSIFETAFAEFEANKGLEKAFMALGWPNFRERAASIYLYKKIYGHFPTRTSTLLVEEIQKFETRFTKSSVNSYSRIFLLGFYLKLSNLEETLTIEIPPVMESYLQLSQGRSEKVDWLILILFHFHAAIGEKKLTECLITGKKFEEIFQIIPEQSREIMASNLLAYGASIHEPDIFLYEKI